MKKDVSVVVITLHMEILCVGTKKKYIVMCHFLFPHVRRSSYAHMLSHSTNPEKNYELFSLTLYILE